MARLTMAQRRALPLSAFAVPSKAPGPGAYPIPDRGHAVAAKGRATQFASPAIRARVNAKANKKLKKKRKYQKLSARAVRAKGR